MQKLLKFQEIDSFTQFLLLLSTLYLSNHFFIFVIMIHKKYRKVGKGNTFENYSKYRQMKQFCFRQQTGSYLLSGFLCLNIPPFLIRMKPPESYIQNLRMIKVKLNLVLWISDNTIRCVNRGKVSCPSFKERQKLAPYL